MTDDEKLAEAEERWRNSGGFENSDEMDCFEDVYLLADEYMRGKDKIDMILKHIEKRVNKQKMANKIFAKQKRKRP